MENKLTEGLLLDGAGSLSMAGYSNEMVRLYRKRDVKASPLRLKEWDYYYIGDAKKGIALTIADNGYMALCSVTLLDFEAKTHEDKMLIKPFSLGKLHLPETSLKGISIFKQGKNYLRFEAHEDGKRTIKGHLTKFGKGKGMLEIDIALMEKTDGKSLVIATPFEKEAHFYYNQKINLLAATGGYRLDGEETSLEGTYGVLDWGRGVWTYKNTWYWSSLSAMADGHLFGWNLGYGFGDTSKASENILYIDSEIHKLGEVVFDIPKDEKGKDDFLSGWRIEGSGLKATFKPVLNRHSDTNLLLLRSNQNQVFGLFSGSFDADGTHFEFRDVPGFAEKVYNRW